MTRSLVVARSAQRWVRALPYVVPLLVLALEWRILSPLPMLADHFQFWAAGHMVVTGLSPYDRSSWELMAAYGPLPGGVAANTVIGNLAITKNVWLYPPQTAFAYAPFGALPLEVGIPLLHVVVVATAVWGVVLAARAMDLTGSRLAFALALVAIGQPFVIGVRDGHPLGLVLGGLTLTFAGVRSRRLFPLVVGAILVSLKPHIAIGYAVVLVGYLIARREWRLLGWTSAAVIVVTLVADIATPYPLTALDTAADERLALDLSNLAALARDLGDGIVLAAAIGALAIGMTILAIARADRSERMPVAFGAVLALSLVVSPYAHDYDQLLNIPAAFVGIVLVRNARYELPLIVLFGLLLSVVPWILFYWWPLLGQPDRVYQAGAIGALPVLTLAVVVLSVIARRARSTA